MLNAPRLRKCGSLMDCGTTNMVISCVAYSCTNRQKTGSKFFYKGKNPHLYDNSLFDYQHEHALIHV